MPAQTYSKTGNKASTSAQLPKSIFGEKVTSTELLKQAYLSYQASSRQNLAKTKTRSDVRGGGRKPWKQKGTGRARAGTIRSPLWRSGGIIFGPSAERTYSKKLNRKASQKALRQALSLADKDNRVAVIDDFDVSDGKTKSADKIIKNTGLERGIVVVCENPNPSTLQATSNLPHVLIISQPSLSAYDVLSAHNVVFTKDALANLQKRLEGVK